jgi:TonB-linked SusC/RagA family outer membrane protein
MRSKFKWIFTLLLALSMQFSFAQEKTVTGVVSDNTGPIPGANVVVKGTTRTTQTDFDGKYSIKAKVGEVLVISFVGMSDKVVTVGTANNYSVILKDGVLLEEVVILGYDKTAAKPLSTAAVVTVTSESLKNRPNVTVLQSLQGQAAGLNVFASSGSPGSAKFDLLIRGRGSANSSTDPLYVVDGVPTNAVVFRNINPEDIDQISVLKDASATTIYGSRAANGVIVIKTKGGSYESPLKVSYSSTYGVSELPKDDYNLMNSTQLLKLQRDRSVSAGAGGNTLLNLAIGRVEGSPNFNAPLTDSEISSAPNQNWMDVFFTTSTTQNHNLSLTSGGKNLNNFTSFSYTEQEGIVRNTDFQRFTFRSNINGKSANEKFKYNTNLTIAFSKRNQLNQETNGNINNNVVQNPLLGGLTAVPYYGQDFYPGSGQGLYDLIGTDFDGGNTTLVLQDLLQGGNQPNLFQEMKILGNLGASYQLTKNLSVNTRLGVDYNVSDRIFARAPWSYLAIAVREINGDPFGGFESRTNDRDFGFNSVTNLKFNKVYGKHTFDAGLYLEYIKAYRQVGLHTQNGLDLATYAFGAGTGWTNAGANFPNLRPTNSAAKNVAGTLSQFASFTYDYDSKFGVDAVVRRDASYRFTDDNQWGTFWSLAGRWNIDKMSFMKNSIFNLLKLRVSTGVQGNQNLGIPPFGTNPIYLFPNLIRELVGTGNGYGNNGSLVLTQRPNNELKWEEQRMTNIGIDFGINKNRLSGSIELYDRFSDDLLFTIPASGPFGAPSIGGNNGQLSNKGVEVSLNYKVVNNDNLMIALFANASYNKNEYKSIPNDVFGDITVERAGTQVGEWFYVPYAGVNPANGNLLFYDINNNLTENPTPDDRRESGLSDVPIYQGGFGFNIDYKGFFLDTQFAWVKDVLRYDTALSWLNTTAYLTDNNMTADILNAWTPTNTNSNIPSLDATNFDLGLDVSNTFLRDASYVRLRNASFGYSFNKKQLEKTFITGLKLFVQAENLYTWTSWRGLDADSGEATNLGRFPAPRTISFGLNLDF